MKRLILVRHAKSSWRDRSLADPDRPLNKRGRRDAPAMGARMARRGVTPARIVSSPAVRALTTAQVVAEAMGRSPEEITLDERVYGASWQDLVEIVRGFEDEVPSVMLVGHNPGFTDLTNWLIDPYIDNVPTCGVVEIEFEGDSWAGVGSVEARLVDFDFPKKKASK